MFLSSLRTVVGLPTLGSVDPEQTVSARLESSLGLHTPVHGSCFLGRAATNHIVLTDDRASRRHAVVQTQGDGCQGFSG